ncbi:MAG TPA: ankyrin repeat domain-containing protein [Candidatus Babeliales bacterium]|nr:ankyrin repeat domain-containing protein [Candidatus Babeliales bacterium]
MQIHRLPFIALFIFFPSYANAASSIASAAIPVASRLVAGNQPSIVGITNLPTTTQSMAEMLSAEVEKQIKDNLDVTRSEADILKMVPKVELDIAKARIALQRAHNLDLHDAIEKSQSVAHIQQLLMKSNVNARHQKVTALIRALRKNNGDEIPMLLLHAGALPNERELATAAQETPLHVVAQQGRLSMTKLLVEEYKADTTAKTKKSLFSSESTPYQVATGEAATYLATKEKPISALQVAVIGAACIFYILRRLR